MNDENNGDVSKKNNIWLVHSKRFQGIPLLQAVSASKANTLLQNITNPNQRNPLFWFLCIKMVKFWSYNLCCWKHFIITTVSQVFVFIRIQLFRFIHVNYLNKWAYDQLLLLSSSKTFLLYISGHEECISWSIQATIVVLSIHSTIVVNIKVGAFRLFGSIEFSFYLNHLVLLMNSHSYFKTHLQYFNFDFSPFLLKLLLWSHTLSCWNSRRRKQGKSSCYIYTGTIVSNYIC